MCPPSSSARCSAVRRRSSSARRSQTSSRSWGSMGRSSTTGAWATACTRYGAPVSASSPTARRCRATPLPQGSHPRGAQRDARRRGPPRRDAGVVERRPNATPASIDRRPLRHLETHPIGEPQTPRRPVSVWPGCADKKAVHDQLAVSTMECGAVFDVSRNEGLVAGVLSGQDAAARQTRRDGVEARNGSSVDYAH